MKMLSVLYRASDWRQYHNYSNLTIKTKHLNSKSVLTYLEFLKVIQFKRDEKNDFSFGKFHDKSIFQDK